MRMKLTVFLLMLLLIASLTACNEADSTSEQEGDNTDSIEPFKYSTMVSTFAEVPDMNNQFWTKFQEDNNLDMDVQWVPNGEFQQQLNLRYSSGDLPDVVSVPLPDDINQRNAIENGVYWDLGPFLGDLSDYPNLKNHIPEIAWELSKIKGTHYYIPRARSELNVGYLMRKDLLDEVGVEVPENLDELHAAMKAVKEEYPDKIGMLFSDTLSFAFGTNTPQYDSDGGLIADMLSDSYTDMVEWYQKIYEDDLMSPEFSVITNNAEIDNFFTSGKTIFIQKNMWHQYGMQEQIQNHEPDAEVALISVLDGPNGSAPYLDSGFVGGLLIPKTVPEDKVEKILEVFDQAASEENSEALYYGYEGIHHNKENGQYAMTDIGLKEIQSFTGDPFSYKRDEYSKVDSPLAPPEVNEKNRDIAQQALDELEIDKFASLYSETWSTEWPTYIDEFEVMRTEAIMGSISMDEYRDYIEDLKNKPEIKQAFLEFAESYQELFE
ncbi:extracellular solute-binding protein [Gracilibacillus phocaeensis]|uniref:extracellular solute-binding protein n=1 Tax=Gracilibacillus phocaeensis TaxID=2042304 RepID=UPI0013EF5A9D|nr:extracellular solute-binding protein [Gracilibacillus phocaeensis]